VPEMLQSICGQRIDHPQHSPQVYLEQRGQIGDVVVVNGGVRIHLLTMMELTMSASFRRRTKHETGDQTSLTCFHVPADADRMIEFEDETRSTQQRLHLDPCYTKIATTKLCNF